MENKVPYPPKDGGSIATLNLAKGLSEYAQITLLTLNTSKHYVDIAKIPNELKEKIKFIDSYKDTKIKSVVALKNLLFSKMPYNAERFICKEFEAKIIKELQENKFDIIQLEGLYLTPYISLIRKYSDSKISLRSHNVEHEIWQRTLEQQTNFFKKQYIKILTSRIEKMEVGMLNKYDLLLPITERDGNKLNKLGNIKPSYTTPTGYEIDNIEPNNENINFPSIFHIGALDWSPNQEGIIWFLDNCWVNILTKMPNLKFYIAGRNAPDWFVEKIKQPNVEFCGEVESATDFINSKALMIVPLLSGSGMRIKIVEGMALGKTIISTSIGAEGIPAIHKDNILIANEIKGFSDEIISIFNNKKTFLQIGINANSFISKNFNNLAISKSLIDFYKNNII